MRKFLNSKYKLFYAIVSLLLIVLGLSYASFVLISENYKASEMLVSNLMYSIEITSLGGEETINGTTVTLSSGKTTAVLVKIKSLNPVNSKYGIDYKITSGEGSIYYANTTTNLPEEIIEDYDSSDTKAIKVIIEATTDITVDFKISGGYTGNSTVDSYTGYTRVTNEYTDSFTITLNATNGIVTSTNPQSTTFNGSLTFNITPNDGYQLNGSSASCELATISIIENGVSITGIKNSQTCTITLKSTLPTLYEKILADNPTVSTRTDFSVTNTANTTGTIYSTTATEDGSTVYYYSGNTTNNWVQFGGFYWRIIRTNEDGSVRMLYSGTSPDTTEGYIGTSFYNNLSSNDPNYVGYMHGTSGSLANNRTNTKSSTIKQTIDTWYENNLLTNYDNYISKTAIYCSDRSIGSGTYNTGSTKFYYGAYTRLYTNKTPTYKCGGNTSGGLFESTQAVEDKFSASTEGGGNGQLQYPIALMTADELVFAGGKYVTGLSSPYAWYYTNSVGSAIISSTPWWTMSPDRWDGSYSNVWYVYGSGAGYLGNTGIGSKEAVRPSISLKSCVLISDGDGTSSNPYTVSVDTACASAEN